MSSDDVVEVAPPPRAGGRRRRLAVLATVVALLAAGVGIGVWAATRPGGPGDAGGSSADAPACPDSVPNPQRSTFDLVAQVPAPPSAPGVDGRLVPTRTPLRVLLCSYPAPAVSSTIALGQQVTLDASAPAAAGVLRTLQDAPTSTTDGGRVCPDHVGPITEYLVGLTYADGLVWVATPGGCAGSTNGATSSGADASAAVAAVFDAEPSASVPPVAGSGSVVGSGGSGGSASPGPGGGVDPDPSETPPADPFAACPEPSPAPPTADRRLVPFTPTGVRICHVPVGPVEHATTVVDRPAAVAAALADAVNASPPKPTDTACADIGGETWRLLFTAAGGQQASVFVDSGGCRTVAVSGRALQATDALFSLLRSNG